MRIYYNPWTSGAHPSGRLPLGRTQSMRWLLLSTTWGSTLGSGLLCESVERALTFAQTTNQRPRAQAHNGFYRDLSLTDDWLICLSCDHTWCCHPVVGNIPFAPRSLRLHIQTCVHCRNRPTHHLVFATMHYLHGIC